MASKPQIDDDDDFGGDYPENRKRSGDKRAFGDLEEEEDDDVFGSKKGKKAEESGPGAATGMILSLRESLQNCKDNLAKCQAELEDAQSEIQKWHSAFQNGPAAPYGANPEPALAITYLQNLKSLEESLKEKLEKAKKREAAFIVTYAKREQEIADLKSAVRDLKKQLRPPSIQTQRLLLDPAIHEEFTRLKNLVEEKEKKVKELLDNVAAVNFSANSRMGKMLMAKCRTLQEENEEIGAMASEGKVMSSIGQAPTTTIPANLGEHARQVGKLSSEHLMPVTTLASVQMNLTSGSILKSDTLPSTCACALMLMTMNWRCLKLSIIFSWSWTVTSVMYVSWI